MFCHVLYHYHYLTDHTTSHGAHCRTWTGRIPSAVAPQVGAIVAHRHRLSRGCAVAAPAVVTAAVAAAVAIAFSVTATVAAVIAVAVAVIDIDIDIATARTFPPRPIRSIWARPPLPPPGGGLGEAGLGSSGNAAEARGKGLHLGHVWPRH